ncbi:MAG: amino acid adenylation domain-containing protein [Methylobacter sp.]|uniref:non-ribosomal peptide synthetase n=1 Tax=Methylobacter sp. TaxID=2051955 RepID=UPI00258F6255|nr:non-ribosomal peptide synthetase [Methylobacter sp.]MCL7422702.1 amino acid adenylation domain-containing protein [Methylobacter sp.]
MLTTPRPEHLALRCLLAGGDRLHGYPPAGLPFELVNNYGPTENSVVSTSCSVPAGKEGLPPIGKPIANTRIYLLDAQGEPVPVGVAGEIHVAGDGIARGYLNRPELTVERFIADPFSQDPEARLYKTGDLGRWREDGSIEFLGRNDFQVKVRGFRIELGEIEARLAACDGVLEAVVIAREDHPGDKRLVAYLTASAELNIDELRAQLKAVLPEYMVPSAFMILDALPLTPNGKLDRKALPAPDAGALQSRQYEAPQGETEQALAALWGELLKVEQVGRHDNFFELGGHSLLAVTLIARMRQAGLNVDVRTLFAAPTLAGLAALADNGSHAEQLVIPANHIPAGCMAITPDMLPLVSLSQADIDRITAAVPGGAANVQDIYPLAPLQEGILFHHLMESEGDAYLLPALMAFDTRERLGSFLSALQAAVARHDILRTAVAWEGLPEPVQLVWRAAELAIEEVVIDPEAGDTAEQLQERYDPRHYRINVRVAPLIGGFTAYDPREGRWLLLLLTHHLALDHTALDILFGEIQMHQMGQGDQLPAPLPFRNFVAQARLGISREEHEAFFRGMLADVDEPTAPFGLLDVQGDGSGVEEAKQDLDFDLARRLREQARTLGISAASLFHLAWAGVLSRTSGRDDVVFGTVLFGRMQGGEGADRVLGMFINTLPLRVQLAQGSVLEQAREVQSRLAGLLRHEHAPLSLAQRCSGVQAPAPLFSALLNYRHSQADAPAESTPEWQGIELLSGEERTNYPIVLSVDDLGEGFSLTAQTLPPVAPERLCALMYTALENLITALENAPDTAMRRVGVLPEAERRQVLYDWNATRADYPQAFCIHELFEAQVRNTPGAVALVFEDQELSYAELNARANRLAHYLRGLGVKPDDRVAICLERGFELVISLLAVLKAGAAYVPLDPAYPEERLAFMLEDCAPLALLTDSSLKARLADRSGGFRLIDLSSDAAQWAHQLSDNPDLAAVGLTPAHLAYVIYTSGSTGQPKGVMVPHAGVMNLVCWHNRQFQVSAADRATQLAGLAFDASAWETWPYLLAGACLHLVRPELLGQPEALWQRLADDRITVAFMPTPLAELMLTTPRPEHLALRCLLAGGDRLHGYPPAGLPFELVNNYGPTENSVVSTSCPVPAGKEGLPPIGKPIANTRVYLLDSHLEPVPVGVMGELYVGGAGLARGYLNRPELTAERFIKDPFSGEPEARLYKTGDLGRWREDGSIEFLGRNDFQVKVRGFRIELGEIEARLAEHPQVRETAVLAREDGPGGKRLVAYYTGDADVTVDSLRAHLAETLPEYMVPAAFVHLEALPLTANGKLDRKALCATDFMPNAYPDFVPPRSTDEAKIAAVWRRLFQVDSVSVTANFFEMGGHSLSAVQLLSLLKQEGIEISIALLFEKPTIESLAWAIREDTRTTEANAIPLRKTGNQSPLFLVHEVTGEMLYGPNLVQYIDSDIPVYGLAGQPLSEVPYRSMQAMAGRLVRMIRAVQPHGPYRLAGWSLGGTIAYEVAAQLIGEDETVEFLGLLDSYYNCANAKDIVTNVDDTALLLDFMLAEDMPPAMTGEITSAASSMDFAELVSKFQALSMLPAHLTVDEFRRFLLRWHSHRIADAQYCARKLPIPIHLYATSEHAGESLFRNWDSVLPEQQIRLIPVTGSHQTMMELPHIESLGAALSTSIREASAAEPTDCDVDYDPLVALQSGSFASTPLFCVPGAGGSVSAFTDLTLALGSSRPVYGFQPRGLDGETVPHATVPAAAKAYLRAIQSLYPEGPLHLIGHSFGGWVVFEMALQLARSGRRVASLTLVDTEAPHEPDSMMREYTESEVLMKLVEIYEQSSGASLEIQSADLDGLEGDAQLKLLHQRLVGVGLMPKQSQPEMLLGTFRTFGTALRTRYCPEHHYAGPLRLVLANTDQSDQEAVIAKWRYWVNDLKYWQSEGNHMTVIKQPYVNALVDWLELGTHK